MSCAIRHETVGPAGSPQRLRIAHLSDFHLWFSDRKLRQIEDLLTPWQPDVLALTGDYADTPTGRRLAVDWIARMAAHYPLCWIAGNHDRWCGRTFLQKLAALPHAHAIDHGDAWITGKNGERYRFSAWDRMTVRSQSNTDSAPTIVLLHEPSVIQPEKLSGLSDHLLLAGHLHGGQITLWRDRRGRPQPASWCFKWLVDRTTIHGTSLIVSRGLGDTWPMRIGAPREIVMIDFSGGAAVPQPAAVAGATSA